MNYNHYLDFDGFGSIYDNISTRKVIFEKWSEKCKIIITSTPVESGTRKLRAVWTPQLADDIAAFQSIDAEKELELILLEEQNRALTRKVMVEKIKPYTIYGINTWTPEFTRNYHNLFAPPQ